LVVPQQHSVALEVLPEQAAAGAQVQPIHEQYPHQISVPVPIPVPVQEQIPDPEPEPEPEPEPVPEPEPEPEPEPVPVVPKVVEPEQDPHQMPVPVPVVPNVVEPVHEEFIHIQSQIENLHDDAFNGDGDEFDDGVVDDTVEHHPSAPLAQRPFVLDEKSDDKHTYRIPFYIGHDDKRSYVMTETHQIVHVNVNDTIAMDPSIDFDAISGLNIETNENELESIISGCKYQICIGDDAYAYNDLISYVNRIKQLRQA
jgi:hypothetical protein